jgi:hypothetical protein
METVIFLFSRLGFEIFYSFSREVFVPAFSTWPASLRSAASTILAKTRAIN